MNKEMVTAGLPYLPTLQRPPESLPLASHPVEEETAANEIAALGYGSAKVPVLSGIEYAVFGVSAEQIKTPPGSQQT